MFMTFLLLGFLAPPPLFAGFHGGRGRRRRRIRRGGWKPQKVWKPPLDDVTGINCTKVVLHDGPITSYSIQLPFSRRSMSNCTSSILPSNLDLITFIAREATPPPPPLFCQLWSFLRLIDLHLWFGRDREKGGGLGLIDS